MDRSYTKFLVKHKYTFLIADLILEVNCELDIPIEILLPNFMPFFCERSNETPICRIDIINENLGFENYESTLLSDISIVWGDRFTFWESENFYWTVVQGDGLPEDKWVMRSDKGFINNEIQIGTMKRDVHHLVSWFLMVAFAQSGLSHKSILIHSSVVQEIDGECAFGFLGKSGTGKSTHSQLWLKYLHGYSLLNDDNPIVRIMPSQEVRIFGTPWSGKTKCYKNESRNLGGLVRLNQAPYNKFEIKNNKEALIALLPSCSALRWNNSLYSRLVDLLIELINTVKIGQLDCLPDEEAAVLCSQQLINQ